jgi:nucleotidyltransferase substrate binding protein (TIGR01987 family)
MGLELHSIENAIESLERAIKVAQRKSLENAVDKDELDTIRAGVIQNFEFTYEQCWKFMKRWLEENVNSESADGVSRRELFRMSAESRLLSDVDKWMEFHRARNITSHTYNAAIAQDVYTVTLEFLPYAKDFLEKLRKAR